jgi:hypothetical protein
MKSVSIIKRLKITTRIIETIQKTKGNKDFIDNWESEFQYEFIQNCLENIKYFDKNDYQAIIYDIICDITERAGYDDFYFTWSEYRRKKLFNAIKAILIEELQ